jgi:hypothetical protein
VDVLIVVSGVLVLVALVFLVIGLLGDGLGFIWASIITSVVAGVFLLLGALQRRGAPAAATTTDPTSGEMLERVTAVSVRPREAEAEPAAPAVEAAMVSIVPGRPRYHVAGCRFLAGRPDVGTVPVDQARADGYTACGVCKPDAAIEAGAVAGDDAAYEAAYAAPATDDTTVLDTAEAADEEPAEAPVEEAPAPRKTAARKAPAKSTSRTAAAGSRAAATATAEAAEAAPAKPAKAAAKPAAKKAAAKATGSTTGQVVVIPDRGKFHTESCRFVKDVPGTVTLTKPAAKRQGYTPCGVCKP